MKFQEAIQTVFSKYATFSGRARRSEFWYFVLFNVIVTSVVGYIGKAIGGQNLENILTSVWGLAILVPSLALSWRRLHDIGKSGLWALLDLIPIVGWIILLIWACKDSQPGENQYGPNPKEAQPQE